MNVKFHKNGENTGKILKSSWQAVIFSGAHKKFSKVLLHITSYIYSP